MLLDFRQVTPEKLLLAAPRGYCAGVDRAVQTVERALELHGPPVYVRKEIVHNKHVVESLRERGAIFVDELDDSIPEGAITVFSAHGVSPAVHADAERRGLQTIDATCPLVTKVHREAVKFAGEGYTIVLIGHAGHEEVEGTMGEAPEHIVLVETEEDVDALEVPDPDKRRLHLPDHAVGRRDALDHQPRCARSSRTSPVRAPTTSVTRRPTARRRSSRWPPQCDLVLVIGSTELVELAAARRRRARLRRRRAPDRQRDPGPGGVARGRARRRHLLGRLRAGGARRAARPVLPRPRHRDGRDVRGHARGRPLHAAEGRSGRQLAARS